MGLLIIFSALAMRNSRLPCPSPDGLSAFWRIKKIHVRFICDKKSIEIKNNFLLQLRPLSPIKITDKVFSYNTLIPVFTPWGTA